MASGESTIRPRFLAKASTIYHQTSGHGLHGQAVHCTTWWWFEGHPSSLLVATLLMAQMCKDLRDQSPNFAGISYFAMGQVISSSSKWTKIQTPPKTISGLHKLMFLFPICLTTADDLHPAFGSQIVYAILIWFLRSPYFGDAIIRPQWTDYNRRKKTDIVGFLDVLI